jgi:hypothetical protein
VTNSPAVEQIPDAVLIAMYKEQCDQARQHETLRQQATIVALTLMTGIISLASLLAVFATSKDFGTLWLPRVRLIDQALGWILVILGALATLLSLKHYERNRSHTVRARAYRTLLEGHYPELRAARPQHPPLDAEVDGNPLFFVAIRTRLYTYWAALQLFVICLGLALVCWSHQL